MAITAFTPHDFPEEVARTIVHHVNRLPFHRINTLKSCALLSHAFVRPAQSHIFSTINFDISRNSRFVVFQSLCGTLLRNRVLGTYVRELQVRSDTSDLFEIHIPAFNAFRTIRGLQKFTFICGRRNGADHANHQQVDGVVGWDHFARTVQANLEVIFSQPSLRTLELGGIQNVPSTLIMSFMKLDRLLLDSHFSVDYSVPATSLVVLSDIRLQSLTLREVGKDLVTRLGSMLAYKPDGLKRLDLAPVRFVGVEEFSSAVWALMRLGGRSLEEFDWEAVAARPHAFKPIDLGSIRTTLRHLTVSIAYQLWFDEPQVLTDLHALLRQLSGNDVVLEVVTIKISFSSGGGSGNNDVTRDPEFLDEWSTLDKILSHKKSFKRLDRVELEYVPSSPLPSSSSNPPVVRTISKTFPSKSMAAPSLSQIAYTKEREWWTDTARVFAERLAGTRSRGVVIAFGESKVQRRSWAVFEPRSPTSQTESSVNGGQAASGYAWQSMRLVDY